MSAMLSALRSALTRQPPALFSHPLRRRASRSCSGLTFRQRESGREGAGDMEQQQKQQPKETSNPNAKTGDTMSHSFGEGYATRSDEEGFGGIYGGNDSSCDAENRRKQGKIHEGHPDYDRSQGSEVAEKEKARHQKTL